MNPTSEKYRTLIRNSKQTKVDTIPSEVNAIRAALDLPLIEVQLNVVQQSLSENNSPQPPLISAPPEEERPKKDSKDALRQINEELRQRGLLPATGNDGPRRGDLNPPF